MVPVFGNNPWMELSDFLLAEMRHRMKMRAAIRNWPGYPRFGHYDTWAVAQLQNIYDTVFGIILYPGWLNGSNYERTPEETTGIAPITSVELWAAINELQLPNLKLSWDLQYLAEIEGVSTVVTDRSKNYVLTRS
jgi:hypothetical protein